MKQFLLISLLFSSLNLAGANLANAADTDFDIPFTKFVLDNGLTLIVHEDRKAPVVAVNVWYHVGSKDEKEGRTGFAHLFEHLMFNGSENNDDDWFQAFDKVGGTGINGTTNQDRTNYFQVVPKNALEMTLWLESDRMGHLLGAIDLAKLDEQRDVVKNEKRQGENRPYGKVFTTILENVYPKGHPYSWSVIGSLEDLNAASVDDVHEWFKTKYGAANATLVVAGDVDANNVKQLVDKYFGHIDAGPPLVKQKSWVAKRTGLHSQVMYDRVPQARIYKIWNIPGWGTEEADYLGLASAVLSSDKKSRLYNRLVYREQVASDISAFSYSSEIGGLFGIVASALDEDKLDYIDQAINEEMAAFFKKGPTKEELSRVKASLRAGFIRGLERVGGFGGKSDILARNQVFGDDPAYYKNSIERIEQAQAKDVVAVSKEWLSDGEYNLRVLPYAEHSTTVSTVDRTLGIPAVGPAPQVSFDKLEKATLSNGLKIILAQRNQIPVVNMQLLFNAGFVADQGLKNGTANITMQMLTEGTNKLDSLEISTKLAELGTNLGAGAGLDSSVVSLNTLKDNLDASMEIFADVILNPAFPETELERLKKQQIAGIAQEKSSPFGVASRVLPSLLYGNNHAYSAPFSGTGDEASVASITVEDLRNYHRTWFKTNNATLIVSGDISMQELLPLAEKSLADLPNGDAPQKNISDIAPFDESVVYLIDRPGSEQSAITAAKMLPKYGFDGELPLQLMNEVLGAGFNSRINLNLREDKGWSYGARSSIQRTQAQRPFTIRAPVQSDKTAESMLEIHKELSGIIDDAPAQQSELSRSLSKRTLTLPGRWETAGAISADISTLVKYGLDESYWDTYVSKLQKVNLEQVNQSAKEHISPNNMLWLVVGDLAKIEGKIRDANLGEIIVIDETGKPVDRSE